MSDQTEFRLPVVGGRRSSTSNAMQVRQTKPVVERKLKPRPFPEYTVADSTSGLTRCVGCGKPTPDTGLYYVGGATEDEPLCAACVCDALLALRMKMQNKGEA